MVQQRQGFQQGQLSRLSSEGKPPYSWQTCGGLAYPTIASMTSITSVTSPTSTTSTTPHITHKRYTPPGAWNRCQAAHIAVSLYRCIAVSLYRCIEMSVGFDARSLPATGSPNLPHDRVRSETSVDYTV